MHNHLIEEQLQKKILIIDGAMGTMLQEENLTADDFGGEELDGCNENLSINSTRCFIEDSPCIFRSWC